VKTTRRASATKAKSKAHKTAVKPGSKQARTSSGRAAAKAAGRTSGPGLARNPGKSPPGKSTPRIPVRGARKSKVSPRVVETSTPSRANKADLAETQSLAVAAIDAALDKSALAPVLIDVSGMGSYTDFIGVVSGRSDRQVDAIADNICQVMKQRGRQVLGQEGTGSGRWTLLDFGAFVIHVFYHPVREFYDLESLWIEAPRVKLDVPAESAARADAYYEAL
jgi:ribosome-associated protein